MEITEALHELAKFSTDTLPVISVYLNTQWRDQHQRERAATFLTRHVRQASLLTLDTDAARQSLEEDLARIAQWAFPEKRSNNAKLRIIPLDRDWKELSPSLPSELCRRFSRTRFCQNSHHLVFSGL